MNGPKVLDEVSARLKQAIEDSPVKDIEKNVRAVLGGVFSRLDLVTREEFDVQREVLLRTRERLVELERIVASLEARLARGPGDASQS
jgi:BMFP domain-containing protein YqiC